MALDMKTGYRNYLKEKGFKDDEITYNAGNIYAKGQYFGSATPEADGSTYDTRGNLDRAFANYTRQTTTQQNNNQMTALRNQLQERINKPVAQFSYNPQADPQYQQALQQAQQNAAIAQGNATARLRANGQGRSSYSEGVAQQIQQRELGNVTSNVLPQLTAQAYQRYLGQQQQENQQSNMAMALMEYLNRDNQQGIQNDRADRQEERQGKQDNWNAYLQSVGLTGDFGTGPKSDYSLLGDRSGNLTMQGQQMQMEVQKLEDSLKSAALQRMLSEAGVTGYYNEKPTMDRENMTFNQNAENRRIGLSAAGQAQSAANANRNMLLDVWKATGKAPAGLESFGVEPGTLFNDGKNKNQVDMEAEKRGLLDSLRSGDLTPETALRQLEEDFTFGYYNKPQYDELMRIISSTAPSYAKTPTLTKEQQDSMPSDKQLSGMVPDGVPIIDWQAWYKDPKGRPAGLSFERWQQLYGPRLGP